ncbi:DNA replication and repair protein RecF [Marinospirillum celere]|uniref:DNA replication and repair protein RecF n=1 Tax=Marinospirillum celere TaxID=1122252 RepID=A0A1I1IE99_9GAMM|nr:DNA replication/repair protein RecF [Marinospirillum celere]SFC32043.1 DNA replication and repair protein RecF [Marinospirillum celere]
MSIQRLRLKNFRNLQDVDFHPTPGLNFLIGKNGSGKTSLLEAIYLLSLVRSFRSKKLKNLINHSTSSFTVFANFVDTEGQVYPLGVQRQEFSDETEILLRGQRPGSIAELTAQLPVQLINPDAFRLLEGGPKDRRQFIDWGVFHVEPSFIFVWQRFQRALKQRNSLLRRGRMDPLQLQLWEKEIALYGEEVTTYREGYLEELRPIFAHLLARLSDIQDFRLSFQRGWDKNLPLLDNLRAGREKDLDQGFTQSGPQRADLRVTIEGRAAIEVLSRGQQKLVVSALKLAQGELLAKKTGKRCIYLIDDLPAELDEEHRQVFCKVLEEQASQVFITSVDEAALKVDWKEPEQNLWFHVEQGQIRPLS